MELAINASSQTWSSDTSGASSKDDCSSPQGINSDKLATCKSEQLDLKCLLQAFIDWRICGLTAASPHFCRMQGGPASQGCGIRLSMLENDSMRSDLLAVAARSARSCGRSLVYSASDICTADLALELVVCLILAVTIGLPSIEHINLENF